MQERVGRPHRGLGAGHVGGREAQRVCCPGSLRRRLDSRGREQQQRRRRRRRERRGAAGAGGLGAVAVSTAAGSGHRGTRQRREAVRGAAELVLWFGPGVVSRVPGDVRAAWWEAQHGGGPGVPGPRGGGQRPARLGHGRFRGRLLAHADARTWPSRRGKAGRPLLVQRGRREHVRSPGRDPGCGRAAPRRPRARLAWTPAPAWRPKPRREPRLCQWASCRGRDPLCGPTRAGCPHRSARRRSPVSVPGVRPRRRSAVSACADAAGARGRPSPGPRSAEELDAISRWRTLPGDPSLIPSDTYAAPSPALRPREKPRQRRRGQQITPLSSETAPVSST